MKENKREKIGIIGRGQFKKFIEPILAKSFDIEIFDRKSVGDIESGTRDITDLNYLIFSVPLSSIEDVCKKIQDKVSEKTILIDVTSVKVEPLKILMRNFLNNQILGTHPIFGPQSGKNGIEN